MSEQHLLLLEDDEVFAAVLGRGLARHGYQVTRMANVDEAHTALETLDWQVAILDLRLAEKSSLGLIQPLRTSHPECFILMLTGYASVATAVQAMRLGANHYLAKPARLQQIIDAIEGRDAPVADDIEQEETDLPSLKRAEWEYIQKTLAENQGNVSATARALGMHRRTLQRKLQKKPAAL